MLYLYNSSNIFVSQLKIIVENFFPWDSGLYEVMASFALIPLAFFCGSLPFSVWLGNLFLGLDVRKFGDGNPGAANAFRSGNKLVGFMVLLLDISKAAAPVGWAYFQLNIRGIPMVLIAIAPILGHVFSPFLGFRGGKALATALGVWIGLTIWKLSVPAVVGAVIGIALITSPGWSVMLALSGILAVILIWLPDALLLAVWFFEVVILAWTHRIDLRQGIHLRPKVKKFFSREKGLIS
jgi:glycerol-3-phosphate acyltransferase PlsY